MAPPWIVVREGYEGLVRGNEAPKEQSKKDSLVIPQSDPPRWLKTSDRPLSANFTSTYFGADSLKDGEADSELKGQHIIRVGWDDVGPFLSEVSSQLLSSHVGNHSSFFFFFLG
jgi:6-phosphofructokinase 1